jgi:hypothetical protein
VQCSLDCRSLVSSIVIRVFKELLRDFFSSLRAAHCLPHWQSVCGIAKKADRERLRKEERHAIGQIGRTVA